MSDLISKQQAIDGLRDYLVGKRCPDDGTLTCRLIENEVIKQLPPAELGTNLAEVGTEAISKQQAIDALVAETIYTEEELKEYYEANSHRNEWVNGIYESIETVKQLPPIQPADNLQKLADEIASFKQHVKSDNSDYLTGYLCALSVVEGMIADMRGKQDG